jgi:hypothetical protein
MTMSGTASVTGNRSSASATTSDSAGGVRISHGTLSMYEESSIRGNWHGTAANAPFADVYANRAGSLNGVLNINDKSKVGTVILNATENDNSHINVGSGFEGSIDAIHLRGSGVNMNTLIGYWTGCPVITGSGADIANALANITLGNFRLSGAATAISATHHIDNAGVLRENP